MKMYRFLAILCLFSVSFLIACSTSQGGGGFNLFTVEQDIELGKQTAQQIADDPQQFPVLPERGNEEIYRYINDAGKDADIGRAGVIVLYLLQT